MLPICEHANKSILQTYWSRTNILLRLHTEAWCTRIFCCRTRCFRKRSSVCTYVNYCRCLLETTVIKKTWDNELFLIVVSRRTSLERRYLISYEVHGKWGRRGDIDKYSTVHTVVELYHILTHGRMYVPLLLQHSHIYYNWHNTTIASSRRKHTVAEALFTGPYWMYVTVAYFWGSSWRPQRGISYPPPRPLQACHTE
jgi:hypothetical protein